MEKILYRDRLGTTCNKWTDLSHMGFGRDDLMGLWVADMDFAAPACVRKALAEKAEFGVYGYDAVPDAYYENFIAWEKKYHGVDVPREWIRYSCGVVAAFNWLVQILTEPGDAVLIQTPVYYPFSRAVEENGRKLVTNELINTDGVYTIDFADMEQKIRDGHVKAFILCSPHNPVGRVWREGELRAMLSLCEKYGVWLISDEIHQDFTYGKEQISMLRLAAGYPRTAVLVSASKTFNMAGLKNAQVLLPDEETRKKFDAYTGRLHTNYGNSFGVAATAAAYGGGREWLDEILAIIAENERTLRSILAAKTGEIVVSPLEGTYLAWIDFSRLVPQEKLADFLENRCGLALDYGVWFGGKSDGFARMNLATRRENIEKAAQAICRNL